MMFWSMVDCPWSMDFFYGLLTMDYRLSKIVELPQARNPQTGHLAGCFATGWRVGVGAWRVRLTWGGIRATSVFYRLCLYLVYHSNQLMSSKEFSYKD